MAHLISVIRVREFEDWFNSLTKRHQDQVTKRIEVIKTHAYFGDWKYLFDGLSELRWKIILLINGGYKNAQKKDIKRARITLRRYEAD